METGQRSHIDRVLGPKRLFSGEYLYLQVFIEKFLWRATWRVVGNRWGSSTTDE